MNKTDSGIKKNSLLQKSFWLGLFAFGLAVLVIVLLSFLFSGKCGSDKAEDVAISALRLKSQDPDGIKILAVSKPDSVFQNRFCPDHEVMEMSEKFLQVSLNLMQDSSLKESHLDNPAYLAKMERYAEHSSSIERLNNMLENEPGKFCGWRVRIRYAAKDKSDTPYTSETWFIFDKDKKHILNSFEIPIL